MSDQEFDNLVEGLRAVDPGNQILTKVGWGYDISKSSLKKCNHKYGVVGSLNTIKIKDANQAAEFSRRSAIITPKLDGISLVAYCSKGILDRILTRADGQTGLDVTSKFAGVLVPMTIPEPHTLAVRGELVLPLGTCKKYYADQSSGGSCKSPSRRRNVMPAALATWNPPGESYPDTYVPSSCDSVIMRWFAMPADETRRIPGGGLSDDECSGSGGPQELIVDDLDRDGRFVMGLSVKLK